MGPSPSEQLMERLNERPTPRPQCQMLKLSPGHPRPEGRLAFRCRVIWHFCEEFLAKAKAAVGFSGGDGGLEGGSRWRMGSARLNDEQFITHVTSAQRALRAFIVGLIGNPVDADDLLQEVNLALWRKREKYDPAYDFKRWAFGFVLMEVRRYRRRSATDRLRFSDGAIEALAADWQKEAGFVEQCNRALAGCLRKLGETEREVIAARFGRRQSVKQIAEATRKPLSTVYKILNRALESLRICVTSAQQQSGHPSDVSPHES